MNRIVKKKNLFIQLYSIHGLVREQDIEFGRDADTGGQVKYVVELAKALSEDPAVEKVELVTRWIKDKKFSDDYSMHETKINKKLSIIRIRAGGGRYLRKETLWSYLEEFIDNSVKHIKTTGRIPDIVHSHYADAGYVCIELSNFFGIPLIHTGHSLGRDKKRKLLNDGMPLEDINKKFNIEHRINVEEKIMDNADLVITSTRQEIDSQYAVYNNFKREKFRIIPPGVDIEKFYPYTRKESISEVEKFKKIISNKLHNFYVNNEKPLILSLCRPDKRKNISGLITAFGEDKELQQLANLAVFAGIRKDIQEMPDNEREVLTEILLLMDKYNLYGKIAIPKRHDTEHEVPELYRITAKSGGIFVNAALVEPFGLTIIEAAGTGVPVVATDDGGPQDIIGNCRNGILVDVSDPKNISAAIKKILKNKSKWEKFSENGIINVRKYYTWKAHTQKYLKEVFMLNNDKTENNAFDPIGKRMFKIKKLVVTDIDNTLLGDDKSLKEFINIINDTENHIAFAVATGRTVDSAISILKKYNVRKPDVFISSVGSEIYHSVNDELVYSKGWDAHISHKWDRDKIVKALKKFKFLTYQEEETQRKFKVSYYIPNDLILIEKIKYALKENKINANIIFSHGEFLDILPCRASKGKAIRYIAYRWNIPYENILVAGDSGNDEEMLKGELLGVVVSNYSPELEKLKGSKRVFFSDRAYAGGIIEGLHHYQFLNDKEGESFG